MRITNSPEVLRLVHGLPVAKGVTVTVTGDSIILQREMVGLKGTIIAIITDAPLMGQTHRYDVVRWKNWDRTRDGLGWASGHSEGLYNCKDFFEVWHQAREYVEVETDQEWSVRVAAA